MGKLVKKSHSLRLGIAIFMATFLAATSSGIGAAGATGAGHEQIDGSGSSWAANAVNQWIADVTSQGLQVVFTGLGSASGRTDFALNTTDFGVSDIGYQGVDPGSGQLDTNCLNHSCRAFAYEPIVAGGTSFPYHVTVAGKLVRNIRLSGETLSKIFTYKITNWNDPAITKDNNGRKLPSLQIIPVVHSEGSGSTAQFTTYMNTEYPSIWQPYAGIKSFLEYYPKPTGNQKGLAINGSDGIMNFISSAAANGAIGYDEYSYPLAKNFPVISLLNKAGYYTLPSQYNVAVALQHAVINYNKASKDYLLQTLNNVYVAPEVQAYPMSSYSYFLIPTGANDKRMTSKKRQTLADFLFYSVCQGQKEMGPIGYSPLPSNLVLASFAQTALLGNVDPAVNVSLEKNTQLASCDNPTFVPGHLNVNHLAVIAPKPPACAKVNAGPCNDVTTGTAGGAGAQGPTTSGGGGHSSGNGGGNPTGGVTNPSGGVVNPTTGATNPSINVPGGVNPTDGSIPGNNNIGGGGVDSTGQPQATEVGQYRSPNLTGVLAPLVAVLILAVLIIPPAVYFYVLAGRKATGS